MGKYFTIDEFRTKFNELLAEKSESDKYNDAKITQIHQHLFGANENKKLNYLIPEYFIEAAKDIIEGNVREPYSKIIKDGKIYDYDELFSTPPNLKKNEKECIFVLTQNNELLIEEAETNRGKQGRMNHSSLAGHKPVKMAGTIHVVTGIIKAINNESGHFTPSKENFIQFLKEYVNIQKLTLCCENFKAKYIIVHDSIIVGDTELEDVSSEDIESYLYDCPREEVQSSLSRRLGGLGGAKRGLFASLERTYPSGGARSTKRRREDGQTGGVATSHAVGSPGTSFLELLASNETDLPTTPPKTPPR